MVDVIMQTKMRGDSVGGVVQGIVLNVPPGIGDPLFDALDATLAHLLFTIPGVRGVEVGSGFKSSEMLGSEHNDPFTIKGNRIVALTNNAGGILGGITNGMPILVNVAFKPTASIAQEQTTVNVKNMKEEQITVKGRHDPCIVPKAVPVVEAAIAVVLVDHLLRAGALPKTLTGWR